MKYEVVTTFSGPACSGKRGSVIEIKDKAVATDLLNAGHIKPFKAKKRTAKAKGKETAA